MKSAQASSLTLLKVICDVRENGFGIAGELESGHFERPAPPPV